jgi:hypothetical protein
LVDALEITATTTIFTPNYHLLARSNGWCGAVRRDGGGNGKGVVFYTKILNLIKTFISI